MYREYEEFLAEMIGEREVTNCVHPCHSCMSYDARCLCLRCNKVRFCAGCTGYGICLNCEADIGGTTGLE
jgi:hypothetical protein